MKPLASLQAGKRQLVEVRQWPPKTKDKTYEWIEWWVKDLSDRKDVIYPQGRIVTQSPSKPFDPILKMLTQEAGIGSMLAEVKTTVTHRYQECKGLLK